MRGATFSFGVFTITEILEPCCAHILYGKNNQRATFFYFCPKTRSSRCDANGSVDVDVDDVGVAVGGTPELRANVAHS